jgi:hypothetical protein
MIYTSYEMIRDCRADRAEGWRYFLSNYIPVVRRILAHYHPAGAPDLLESVLGAMRKPESSLFQSLEPAPERNFVAELRQKVLEFVPAPEVEIPLDLETLAAALAPLTLLEKQAAWIETMGYDAASTGAMLRMAPQTVEKIRERAAELLRGGLDSWRRTLPAENGRALGRAAAAGRTAECPPAKVFLDVLDGRATWSGRQSLEPHVTACWHCIDHFARVAEVVELIRGIAPLAEAEAEPYFRLLGVAEEKRAFWKRH